MSIFIQFKNTLRDFGLEYFQRYYGIYRAQVFDNKDPEYLGRLRVRVPQIYGQVAPERWAPALGAIAGKRGGVWWIPSVNDPIYVMFEGGDARYPVWTYGWWLKDAVPETAKRKDPTNYVIQTPGGLRIELDDQEEYIKLENKAGFSVNIKKDGFFIGKDDNNLGKLMDDLFALYAATTTATKIGPQGFINIADYTKLKAEFKKLLLDAS